jgi:N-acyl-L-homoserine lactone synthetase
MPTPLTGDADVHARVDRFVVALLARAAPLHFTRAETVADRDAIFRLRYDVVVESGWASAQEFPDGMEHDAYDEDAIQIAGWDGEVLACTTRLVIPRVGRPQPVEAAFGLTLEPQGRVVDCGRVIVAPRYRKQGHLILWALLGRVWQEMRAEGFDRVAGIFSGRIIALYEQMGFRVRVLGPGKMHWHQERFPILLDVLGSIEDLERCAAIPSAQTQT